MGNTPAKTTDTTPDTQNESLQPDMIDSGESIETMLQTSARYLNLSSGHKAVLLALIQDFMSENIRTDVQIAEDLGICRDTVYHAKTNPSVITTMGQLLPELVKSKAPKHLTMIAQHGEKDWRALEFLTKFSGLYTPTNQNLNLNANISASSQDFQPASPQQYSEQVASNYMSMGYDLQSTLDAIEKSWHELKAQGM